MHSSYILTNVYTADERTRAALARLKAEIELKYGTVKAFAPLLTTIRRDALRDNLNGTSMPRLNVILEILEHLDLSLDELMRRADADLEARSSG